MCVCVCHAVGAAATTAPVRETDFPHWAAEAGGDEGSPAEGAAGAAGLHNAAFRSVRTYVHMHREREKSKHLIRNKTPNKSFLSDSDSNSDCLLVSHSIWIFPPLQASPFLTEWCLQEQTPRRWPLDTPELQMACVSVFYCSRLNVQILFWFVLTQNSSVTVSDPSSQPDGIAPAPTGPPSSSHSWTGQKTIHKHVHMSVLFQCKLETSGMFARNSTLYLFSSYILILKDSQRGRHSWYVFVQQFSSSHLCELFVLWCQSWEICRLNSAH